MAKLAIMDSKTGEVKEMEVVCPFRSITDLKREELRDGEDYVEGTSVTTLEGYEPLESIVARCTRQVVSPNGTTYNVLDTDALKAEESQTGIYEAGKAQTLDEAFATMDPTDEQGFDLADASVISEALNQKSKVVQANLSTERANEAHQEAKVSDGTVGKSDTTNTTSQNNSDFPEAKE